ncbi:hypothetical protein Tco_0855479 [Tanacetum coccineum]
MWRTATWSWGAGARDGAGSDLDVEPELGYHKELCKADVTDPKPASFSLSKRNGMMFCTIESKPLALPWGRTPRLDSGVRVSSTKGCLLDFVTY